MKKYFLLAVACLLAFSSCEDVPAPYEIVTEIIPGGGDAVISSREEPLAVADAISALSAGKSGNFWVKGNIVGYIPTGGTTTNMSVAVFKADSAVVSNLILAPSASETDGDKCMAIQLPVGAVRSAVNLADHADNLGKEVLLYGSLEKYCGAPGLKNVSFAVLDGNEYGTDPDKVVVDSTAVKGAGTAADPFNVAAAIAKCKTAGETATTDDFYVKGIASAIDTTNVGQYGNISIDLVDVVGSANVFKAYRIKSYGGASFTAETANGIKAGDTVVVVGKLVNYKSNTPETTAGAKLFSVNGVEGSGNSGGNTTTVDPKGTGSETDPFNVAAAIAKCTETGTTATADVYYVEGIAKSINSSGVQNYGNISIDLIDVEGSTSVFTAYQVFPLDGKFATGTEIKVGDKVLVKGQLVNYNGSTPETSKGTGYVVKVNGSALTLSPTIVIAASTSVSWDVTTANISYSVANGVSGDSVTVSSLTEGATCTISAEQLNVTLPGQNTTEDNLEYQFKLSYPGADDVTIKVVQKKKPAEGETMVFTSNISWTKGANSYEEKATVNETADIPVLKLGKSAAAGTSTLTIPEGVNKIGFFAVTWNNVTTATVTVGSKEITAKANTGATGTNPYTLTVTEEDYYEVAVEPGTVEVTCPSRVIIFGINAK